MKSLRVISLLMEYPTAELMEAREELKALVASMNLKGKQRDALLAFVEQRTGGDLMDWQSEYDALFERGRSLSLLLFEHVHGESRDRGQAMVDLMNQYKQAGLEIDALELPDYLPLYLEFLSTQGEENGRLGLAEVSHILALLTCRLQKRDSRYHVLTHALLSLSGVQVDLDSVREQIAAEKRDDTKEALDKVWEEEAVTFGPEGGADACGSATNKPSDSQRRDDYMPITWTDNVGDSALDHDATPAQRGV